MNLTYHFTEDDGTVLKESYQTYGYHTVLVVPHAGNLCARPIIKTKAHCDSAFK